MNLPEFRYHPDPIASGSVVVSDKQCRCCKQKRGYIYDGPVYAEDDLDEKLCPWCISDGAASVKFDATFIDSEAFADDTPESAMDEISLRTPGFSSWQGEQWPACCDDATAFLMPAGTKEIREHFRELERAAGLPRSLNKEEGPTAYVFRCLHCESLKFYVDQP